MHDGSRTTRKNPTKNKPRPNEMKIVSNEMIVVSK